jgi:hypothetical protein
MRSRPPSASSLASCSASSEPHRHDGNFGSDGRRRARSPVALVRSAHARVEPLAYAHARTPLPVRYSTTKRLSGVLPVDIADEIVERLVRLMLACSSETRGGNFAADAAVRGPLWVHQRRFRRHSLMHELYAGQQAQASVRTITHLDGASATSCDGWC